MDDDDNAGNYDVDDDNRVGNLYNDVDNDVDDDNGDDIDRHSIHTILDQDYHSTMYDSVASN